MATTLIVKENALETIVVRDSPYDTSALPVKAYLVLENYDINEDGTNVKEVGSLANGEIASTDIEIPCFFERAEVEGGGVYSMEIIAGPDTANPIVLASDNDLYIRIEEVHAL